MQVVKQAFLKHGEGSDCPPPIAPGVGEPHGEGGGLFFETGSGPNV